MDAHEQKAIGLLAGCRFAVGSFPKRFIRDLMSLKVVQPDRELTENQKNYLWKLVYQYRKQHRNKWFIYYAHKKANIEKPINPKDYL